MEPLTVFTFIIAFGLFVWGFLVGIKRMFSLIPRYSPSRVKNDRGYTMWIGYNLMVLGTLGGIDGVFQTFFPDTHISMFLGYAIIIIPAIVLRIMMGKKRFEEG